MRSSIAAFVATFLIVLPAPPVQAAPTQVSVRIEGKAETLFEGPILTDVHRVKDANDSVWRRCNGITALNPAKAPAVVPTSASSDAMRIINETFDGLWYSQWEDYFIERWGPDSQDVANSEYWGVLVNNSFTDVGGCQYRLDGGDEVLWVYDAFDNRPRMVLYPAGYPDGALPLTATATLNQPFEVEVDTWASFNEGTPPPSPTRSTTPYVGAEVAPVETDAKGFQKVDVASASTVTTDATGRASITFTEPGWHRIKAADLAAGVEVAIRSNRLDVCVPQPPASGCGAPPDDDLVRTPPPPLPGEIEEEESEEEDPQEGGQPSGDGAQVAATGPAPPAVTAAEAKGVQLQLSRLDRSRIGRGLVRVSWRVLDAGVGLEKWTIASKTLGRKGVRWVNRASGSDRTSATVRLPTGATYRLRLTIVDTLGRSSGTAVGKVRVPR
jgi:hypothetical protein